jgi:hypothetical protein
MKGIGIGTHDLQLLEIYKPQPTAFCSLFMNVIRLPLNKFTYRFPQYFLQNYFFVAIAFISPFSAHKQCKLSHFIHNSTAMFP